MGKKSYSSPFLLAAGFPIFSLLALISLPPAEVALFAFY